MKFKLSKRNILKKNKQFQHVYRLGTSYANRYMVFYVFAVNEKQTKVGFAAGKRLGSAVIRNRVKRLLREVYREHQYLLKQDFYFIIVGRKPMVNADYDCVCKNFIDLCIRARILSK